MVKNILSFFCIAAMLAGAYFVLYDWNGAVGEVELIKPEKHLEIAMPMDFDGLKGRDIPLGNTEEVTRATEKILAVNEFLNREYTLPDGRKFSVYISYWAPKKEPVRVASTHTPDRCWVRNGWKNDDSKKKQNEVLRRLLARPFHALSRHIDSERIGLWHRHHRTQSRLGKRFTDHSRCRAWLGQNLSIEA